MTAADRLTETFDQRLERFGREIDLTFPRFPERSTIHARDGTPLARLFLDENRKVVHLRNVSHWARKAVIAVEDADFYEHGGVDYRAIGRAALRNLLAGEIEQGASTITQQVARNVVADVGQEESLSRKVREAYVSLRLEERYTKHEILELYLNETYFGAGAHGVGTAARRYFGKPVRQLNLRESALLAGLIAAPERYNPFEDRQAARARRNVVLDRMVTTGAIDRERAEEAKSRPLGLTERKPLSLRQARAPYFVEYVKREILSSERFGQTREARERLLFQGGLHIHTTLRLGLQRAARKTVRRHLPRPNDPEAALVSVNPATGAIWTLVGGRDFEEQKFDLATQGRRQPGSAFKPFTLVAALENGISPRRTYRGASPVEIELPNGTTWKPVNAGDAQYGKIDLRAATRNSVNTVFAQLIMDVGSQRVVDAARRMGIRSELPAVPSLTLGTAPVSPLEMASAYTTLANSGSHCPPFAIRNVVDRDGEAVAEGRNGRCQRRIPRGIALRVVSMLEKVVEAGTGTAANLPGRRQFGKTGTTDDFADGWFLGCTQQLCTSSWVGHIEGRIPMRNVHGTTVYGGTFPARIWRDFMAQAMDGRPVKGWPAPPPMEPAEEKDEETAGTESDSEASDGGRGGESGRGNDGSGGGGDPSGPGDSSRGGGSGSGGAGGAGGAGPNPGDDTPTPTPSPSPTSTSSPSPSPTPTPDPGPTNDEAGEG